MKKNIRLKIGTGDRKKLFRRRSAAGEEKLPNEDRRTGNRKKSFCRCSASPEEKLPAIDKRTGDRKKSFRWGNVSA